MEPRTGSFLERRGVVIRRNQGLPRGSLKEFVPHDVHIPEPLQLVAMIELAGEEGKDVIEITTVATKAFLPARKTPWPALDSNVAPFLRD